RPYKAFFWIVTKTEELRKHYAFNAYQQDMLRHATDKLVFVHVERPGYSTCIERVNLDVGLNTTCKLRPEPVSIVIKMDSTEADPNVVSEFGDALLNAPIKDTNRDRMPLFKVHGAPRLKDLENLYQTEPPSEKTARLQENHVDYVISLVIKK